MKSKYEYFIVREICVKRKNPFELDNSFRRNPKPNPYDDELPGMHDSKKAIIVYLTIFWFVPIAYIIYRGISNS